MKFLLILFILFCSLSVKSETFKNVYELHQQCKDVINSVNNNDFSNFDDADSTSILESGICMGYFAGIVEGHQIGWSSANSGEKYCKNSNTIFELIKIFDRHFNLNPNSRDENVRSYFYDLFLNNICD